jgi:hypothetical protein
MRCAVKYSELYKQLIGLILFPLALTAVYLLVMYVLQLLKVSETMQHIYSIGGSVVLVLIGIFIVRKNVLIDADAEYDLNGVHFQLKIYLFCTKKHPFQYCLITFKVSHLMIMITIEFTCN